MFCTGGYKHMQNFKSKITKFISIIGLVGLLALVTTACANKKNRLANRIRFRSLQLLMFMQILLKISLENTGLLRRLLIRVVQTRMTLIPLLLMLRN